MFLTWKFPQCICSYLSAFENAKSGDFLPANSIAGKFRPPDLTPISTA